MIMLIRSVGLQQGKSSKLEKYRKVPKDSSRQLPGEGEPREEENMGDGVQ